jgi:tyrosyl-tRNA synthetase
MHELPLVADCSQPVVEIVRALGFAASNGEVRRVAEQKGLRLVVEPAGGGPQEQATLTAEEVREPLADVMKSRFNGAGGDYYLKVGRRLARINQP